RPDQDPAVLIDRQSFGIDEFFLERLQVVVVQMEANFERPIGKPLLPLEQFLYLGQEFVKRHAPPSRVRGAGMRRSLSLVCRAHGMCRAIAVDRPACACSRLSSQVIALPPPRCLRRMIATFRPAPPRHDHGWTVHLQPGDSSTSYWTQAAYSRPTVKPL